MDGMYARFVNFKVWLSFQKLKVMFNFRVVWMLGGLSHMEVDVDGPVSQVSSKCYIP
jgi:hypothetical protein